MYKKKQRVEVEILDLGDPSSEGMNIAFDTAHAFHLRETSHRLP